MDNKYRSYIINKYKIKDMSHYFELTILDALDEMNNSLKKENFILKGAFNLFKNHGYTRAQLTRDSDYSLTNLNKEQIETFFRATTFDTEWYLFIFVSSKHIAKSNVGYGGLTIKLNAKVKGRNTNTNIKIDIAHEEIDNTKGILVFDHQKAYSIERTLADKYVSMIQLGDTNTRNKDFVDLKALFPNSDKELLFL
ncbi:MAG: nucleotidyl transferase AbiEii/AbiGii toxin family protein [Mycoplasmataceae bacterium]|nr:nucleotidyl transferase AbiEii/AbiGii toxin family protein [Mycoplasmataceae bacterium]